MLAAAFSFSFMTYMPQLPVFADQAGQCGESAYFSLTDGVLEITGTGTVNVGSDYRIVGTQVQSSAPWMEYQSEITAVTVAEGITDFDGIGAFLGCEHLTDVTLPDSLTALGGNTFFGCTSLREITLPPQVTVLQNQSFWQCTALEAVTLPDGLTEIQEMCFGQCTALKKITIPETVTKIGSECFADCTALTDIRFAEGSFPEAISSDAFDGAEQALEQNGDYLLLDHGRYLYRYTGSGNAVVSIPETVQYIGSNAFWRDKLIMTEQGPSFQVTEHPEIEQIIFPEGLRRIGGNAFRACSGLSSVDLPDTLTELDTLAFTECTALARITLPQALETLGSGAFMNCTALEALTFPPRIQAIPSLICSGCTALQSVQLPENVSEISDYCFNGCASLEEINLPDSIVSVGQNAFKGTPLIRLSTDFTTALDKYLLDYTGSDANVVIPEGITVIASNAFSDNTVLGDRTILTVTCPQTLRGISSSAFQNQAKLTRITLNDGLLRIGYAISACPSLTALSIPDSVETIQGLGAVTSIEGRLFSAAHAYALENGLEFTDTGIISHGSGTDRTVDPAKDGWYFGNSGAAFGDTFYFTDSDAEDVQLMLAVQNGLPGSSWNGSCFGLALTVLLAKAGRISPGALQENAQTLSAVEPAPEIISMINYYHCVQYSREYLQAASRSESHAQTFLRLADGAAHVSDGALPLLVDFTTGANTRHAVLAYGAEKGEWEFDGVSYDRRILTWDPNFPGVLHEPSCVYYSFATFDYCIPQYQTAYSFSEKTGTGQLNAVCNDLSVVNAYPYPTDAAYLSGDMNCDSTVNIADAVLLARFLAEDPAITVSAQGKKNADADQNGTVDSDDRTVLLKRLANITD